MFEDKVLICRDCGREFTFTAGEQEFYAEKGFQNEPVRCRECRNNRKNASRKISKRQKRTIRMDGPFFRQGFALPRASRYSV